MMMHTPSKSPAIAARYATWQQPCAVFLSENVILSFTCCAAQLCERKTPGKNLHTFPVRSHQSVLLRSEKPQNWKKKLGFSKGRGTVMCGLERTRRGICGQVGHLRNVCSMFPIGRGTALCCC